MYVLLHFLDRVTEILYCKKTIVHLLIVWQNTRISLPLISITGDSYQVRRAGLTKSVGIGPVSVRAGTKPTQIQNSNLNSKNKKFPKKVTKNTSRCDESNGVKFSKKFVHLV